MTIQESIKSKVVNGYLYGVPRDGIARSLGIVEGSTSNIINDWKINAHIQDIDKIRKFSAKVKKSGISIDQCIQGYEMFQLMINLGLTDINKGDSKLGNSDSDDIYSNNQGNFEFLSFLYTVYLNCKNHGIEPDMALLWIDDLYQFISKPSSALPNFSNAINNPTNNNIKNSSPRQKQETYIISEDAPLISKISNFIDKMKKERAQLENNKENLIKDIGNLQIKRNSLKVNNDQLLQKNNKIIGYLDDYYIIKKELSERFSIDIDEDFKKFANLFNEFRKVDFKFPKIIEKYVTAQSIEDKIKEETLKLERLQNQKVQLNNSLVYWQNKINQYKQTLDIYHRLESMGFDFKRIEQLHNTILEIAKANNIPNDGAVLKFFKDLEEQYNNKLGFELKIDEKRKEIDKINIQIIDFRCILQATPFIGPAMSRLYQKGVFEQDVLAVSQLIDEYTNNVSKHNENNNDIENNASKVEKVEKLIKDLQNYKNIKIEMKEKQFELDSLQKAVNDLYNQKQQIEKYLENFKSFMEIIKDGFSYNKEWKDYIDRFNAINLSARFYPLLFIYKNSSESHLNTEKT